MPSQHLSAIVPTAKVSELQKPKAKTVVSKPMPIEYDSEDDNSDVLLKTEFPDLDDNGKDYATKIAENVVVKLKVALGIPDGDTSHWQLMKFFSEKFEVKKETEFGKNMPDKPDLEILSA